MKCEDGKRRRGGGGGVEGDKLERYEVGRRETLERERGRERAPARGMEARGGEKTTEFTIILYLLETFLKIFLILLLLHTKGCGPTLPPKKTHLILNLAPIPALNPSPSYNSV